MKTEIFKTYSDFVNRPDKTLNGVTQEFADANKWAEERNNEGCWNCSDCSDCSRCSRCSGMAPQKITEAVPVIPNIHATVLAAVTPEGALKMNGWHTCETTHCRAGWVVTLAGEAGKKLEERTSTSFAAMRIYKESSPIRVSPVRFFDSNEKAMEDIRKCADDEAKISPVPASVS